MLWALFAVLAAAGQTMRNAMQRDLVARVGVVGATHVRFLFGFPFALLFLALMWFGTGDAIPTVTVSALPAIAIAAATQALATGLMLQAMKTKSFVVTIAYTKTEPVLVALFGLVFLGERLSGFAFFAIGVATFGVLLTAWPRDKGEGWSLPAITLGLLSAAMFAISAVAFRAAIHALPSGGFGIRASTILAIGLGMQAGFLTLYLMIADRAALRAILVNWKPSLFAGFLGALASQFWFLGFALISAAKVRTVGLVEVLFARLVSGTMFSEKTSRREAIGLVLIVLGVGLLLSAAI